jgi:hypothetical protein
LANAGYLISTKPLALFESDISSFHLEISNTFAGYDTALISASVSVSSSLSSANKNWSSSSVGTFILID